MGIKFITMLWNLCQRFENNDNEYFEFFFFFSKVPVHEKIGGNTIYEYKRIERKPHFKEW